MTDLFKAHLAAGMYQIQKKLTNDLIAAGRISGLAVIVFANARKPFSKSDILPLIGYWNYRSKDYVSFFFVGFVGDTSTGESEFSPNLGLEAGFDEQVFVETIEEFEQEASWNYEGDTPIILCSATLMAHKDTGERWAFLDLTSIIEFELERALKDKVIESVESFFEAVIRAAKSTPGDQVHWRLSDTLGTRALGSTLIESICGYLPKGTEKVLKAIKYFRVKE